jgi:cysteinyl-tRNA synthetase
MDLYLYNTINRKKEQFKPISDDLVGLYTCGPTVYNYAHIGNLRTYLFEDFLVRTLNYNGYNLKRVMNITDVGHLTGDMDLGDDKMEAGAHREGKSAWEIASYYTDAFREDLENLNILMPDIWCKATDNISEQIEMVKILDEKGYLYPTQDGLYFDTAKFPDYNRLSHLPLDDLKEGARIEKHPEKKNPTDFAVWKFSPSASKRQMEWQSPWGLGFPGWHLECSAMSLKYLGKHLDIHCGGIDHINIHHTNEIAQSEAATGDKFFNYWLHGAFLNISKGEKMGKSKDGFLTLSKAILTKNINPLAFRLAALQVHYRKEMVYSEDSILQAERALISLYRQISSLTIEPGAVDKDFQLEFLKAINDDLNMPQALAVLFQLLKSDLSDEVKLATALKFDQALGLSLQVGAQSQLSLAEDDLPEEILSLVERRKKARQENDWSLSDSLRKEINNLGYLVEDNGADQSIKKK